MILKQGYLFHLYQDKAGYFLRMNEYKQKKPILSTNLKVTTEFKTEKVHIAARKAWYHFITLMPEIKLVVEGGFIQKQVYEAGELEAWQKKKLTGRQPVRYEYAINLIREFHLGNILKEKGHEFPTDPQN